MQTAESARDAAATPPAPAAIYKFCGCLAKSPGRACLRCWDFHWLKSCPDCLGVGTLNKSTRLGAQDRTERCGRCMGQGWQPCPKREIPLAEQQEARRKAEREEEEFDAALGLQPAAGAGPTAAAGATQVETSASRSSTRRSVLKRNQSRRKPKPLPADAVVVPDSNLPLAGSLPNLPPPENNLPTNSPFAPADLESPFLPRSLDPDEPPPEAA